MRAEGAGGSRVAEPAQARAPAQRAKGDDFQGALRVARERQGKEGRAVEREAEGATPTATPTPTASATASANPLDASAPHKPEASRAAEVAGRALATVAAQRNGLTPALRVEAADGIRYELAGGAGGVELRALAPPLLERVARADLHAVADGCGRRGVRLARATVQLDAVGRGRKDPGGKR